MPRPLALVDEGCRQRALPRVHPCPEVAAKALRQQGAGKVLEEAGGGGASGVIGVPRRSDGLADAIRAELERPQRPEPLTQVRQRSVDSLLVESHRGEAVAKLLQQG